MRTLALVRRSEHFVAGMCVEWRSAGNCAEKTGYGNSRYKTIHVAPSSFFSLLSMGFFSSTYRGANALNRLLDISRGQSGI